MDSPRDERAPLLQQQNPRASASSSNPKRTVTFNPTVSTLASSSTRPATGATLASQGEGPSQQASQSLHSRLRRRHSAVERLPTPGPKPGAQRTTKNTQKLKLLPDPEHGEEGQDEESGREVYSQFTRIKDPTARRDAARLGKEDRAKLPRVTAYCTAAAYKLDDLMKFLRGRGKKRGAAPKLFDECVYTTFSYEKAFDSNFEPRPGMVTSDRRYSDSAIETEPHAASRPEDAIDAHSREAGDIALDMGDDPMLNHSLRQEEYNQSPTAENPDFDTKVLIPEVFLFNYGTVVIWGMTEAQEERFLNEISRFETEKLDKDDVQVENFNFYYTRDYQARIYNDFISLREKKSYMTKLAISHALSQSVKVRPSGNTLLKLIS